MPKPTLIPDEILTAEFEYAANCAFQANEDRSKAASFFLVSVGSLVAAIFGTQAEGIGADVHFLLAGLFLVLTILGGLTVAQLARLRAAWHESALAMNTIKEYYAARFDSIELERALRWTNKSLPPVYKADSISFLMVTEVALLGGLTFGASVFFFLQGIEQPHWQEPVTALAAVLGIGAQFFWYSRLLKRLKKKEKKP